MSELGKAYVQIVPSAKGISGSISNVLNGESEAAGKAAGLNIAGAIKGAIAAIGIGALIKETFSQGAELQQSIGGIETLFGTQGAKSVEEYAALVKKDVSEVEDQFAMLSEAQSIAMENASRAYETAGLSANDYMQTVTGFAAALKSSTENEVEAARVADQAVIDMSDNANKMGTSMESIQNAYQGFAKQNYTMLDNLKLGYGGTKSEMERLLADATKLSGVEYDINSLSDVYEAIHVIQEDLGITGTTAKEASQTFSGSMAAMKAAAQNVLGNLFLGEDIGPSMEALAETVSTFLFGNLIPAAVNILKGLPSAISAFLTAAVPELISNGKELVASIGEGLLEGIPQILETAGQFVADLRTYINEELPGFLESGTEMIANMSNGFLEGLPGAIEAFGELLMNITQGIMEALPVFMEAGMGLITQMAQGFLANLPAIIEAIGTIVANLLGYLLGEMPNLMQKGFELISNLAQGLLNNIPEIIVSIASVIANLQAEISQHLPEILEKGIEIIANVAAGIIQAIPDAVAAIPEVISGIVSKFEEYDWASIGANIISGIANAIIDGAGRIIDAAKNAARDAFEAAKSFLGIASPSKLFYYLGDMTVAGYVNAVEDGAVPINEAVGSVLRDATGRFSDSLEAMQPIDYQNQEPDDRREDVYHFEIPFVMDGREFARASATYTQEELNRLSRNKQRKEGFAW